MRRPPAATVVALFASLALVASACGSGGDETSSTPASSVSETDTSTAAANAAANTPILASNDDVRLIEVLDVRTGEIATLADTVDGDRPVLIWFWAPF
jgi:hypothetical protein